MSPLLPQEATSSESQDSAVAVSSSGVPEEMTQKK